MDEPRHPCEPRFALPPLRRLYRWHPEEGHYSLLRDDDDDWEEYKDNIYIYEYNAERPVFKRVAIASEYDANTNQFVRVADRMTALQNEAYRGALVDSDQVIGRLISKFEKRI